MTAYISHSTRSTIPATTRCDRCIGRATVRATFDNRGSLHFCGHHYNQHQAVLTNEALAIEDERTPESVFIRQPVGV